MELTNDNKKYKSLKKVYLDWDTRGYNHNLYNYVLSFIFTQEHAELQEKYAALQETVAEQEIAMVEMGRQLSL